MPAVTVRRDLDPVPERIERRVEIIEVPLGIFLLRLPPRFTRPLTGGDRLALGLRAAILLRFQNGLLFHQALLVRAPLRELCRVLLDGCLLGGKFLPL